MRVRFAPSPTGALHIGSARTALYNWLLARDPADPGELVLRVEDTDRERSTEENVAQILDALQWLQIDWDGDVVFQSARADRHEELVQQLIDAGHAYRSTAGPEQVKAWHDERGNQGFRGSDEGEGATRLRIPDEGVTVVRDLIRGESEFANALQDDLVIARADGSPVYHMAVVADDLDAGITHVVRGADHYSNTPKQQLILAALGQEPPLYAHLPLLHGTDGKKLSKRHGAASVQELRAQGYLPEAVRNYIALLGWGPGGDSDETFFTDAQLQEQFDITRVSRSPAIFDEAKLRWMNGRYLRELSVEDLQARLEDLTGRELRADVVAISQEKMSTLDEFWPLSGFFFDGPVDDPKARQKVLGAEGADRGLAAARAALEAQEDWTPEALEATLRSVLEREGLKPKQVFQPVRVALAGGPVSPGLFETIAVMGREETLRRIDGVPTVA